ncbi:MAG: hypothetical protein R2795_26395 [Saprospiraceae bacterium]
MNMMQINLNRSFPSRTANRRYDFTRYCAFTGLKPNRQNLPLNPRICGKWACRVDISS